VKFKGHFHGWHDYATAAVQPPFDVPMSSGVPGETLSTVLVAEPNDIASVRSLLDQHDVAAVILEPGGGSNSVVPTRPEFLKQLRGLTRERGVVLIFDEVISGFRFAPGGAQEHYGVVPDMTTMAKILAGGLPGGAVGGRQEILDILSMKTDPPDWNRGRRIAHPGTFNANPLSSAAGVACLEIVATGEPHRVANRLGGELRRGFNECSVFHVALGLTADDVAKGDPSQLMQARPVGAKLRKAMLLEGVDLMRTGGFVSGVHTESDVAFMVEAFDRAIARMQEEGAL
jgi:glutamate-1-semialdehyde 2,1-aminomutase